MSSSTNKLFMASAGTVMITLGLTFTGTQAASAAALFGTSWDGQQNSLQNLLNGVTVSGPQINTVQDQKPYQVFTNTATGGSLGSLMFEVAGFKDKNQFGIYNIKDTSQKVLLFDGANKPAAGTKVDFLTGGINVTTQQFDASTGEPSSPPPLGNQFYKGFTWNNFGFYLQNGEGKTFYTQNSLNPDQKQQAVVYQGNNATTLQLPGHQPGVFTQDEYIIAFEDLALGATPLPLSQAMINGQFVGSDWDYNDMVVMMESIKPVPEPTTLAGLGVVASLLSLKRRRNTHTP